MVNVSGRDLVGYCHKVCAPAEISTSRNKASRGYSQRNCLKKWKRKKKDKEKKQDVGCLVW